MSKKIVSLHPVYACKPGFFNRDFGQIWFTFQKEKWYTSEAWSLKEKWDKNFIIQWQKWRWFTSKIVLYYQLFKEAKKIDILHMYHIYTYSFIWSMIYRLRNKKGKIFIKMDTPLKSGSIDYRKEILKLNKLILRVFFNSVDYIWFEDIALLNFYEKEFKSFKDKFILTTSWWMCIDDFIWNIDKENAIVLCWRFWSQQKNNELFLEYLKTSESKLIKQRKIYLIWSYTDDFIEKVTLLKLKKPEYKNLVIMTWFFDNKKDLFKIMSKCKLFVHTASWEWDPNIQYDAMFCWCYMVSTDVANIKQNYTEKYGTFYKIKSLDWLKIAMKVWIEKVKNTWIHREIQKRFLKKFTRASSLKYILDRT